MRVWYPIPPLCLDRKRLLGEHREVHAIWTVLTTGSAGYRNHPEVVRWRGHLPELAMRHLDLEREMLRRGYSPTSPIRCPGDPLEWNQRISFPEWPEPWEPVETMRAKLAAKLAVEASNARMV
jgi:hypothetical protein